MDGHIVSICLLTIFLNDLHHINSFEFPNQGVLSILCHVCPTKVFSVTMLPPSLMLESWLLSSTSSRSHVFASRTLAIYASSWAQTLLSVNAGERDKKAGRRDT